MLELGRWSEALHRDIGYYVVECGFHARWDTRRGPPPGGRAKVAGLAADAAYFFDDPAQAGSFLCQVAHEGDVILFKGSRGTRVEIALDRF